jgi:membrane protein EpsK
MSSISAASTSELPARRGQFAINLLANVGQLGLSSAIGLWYVPFLIRHLGPSIYGLLPLATTMTSYMAMITLSFNSAVARSMTIALEQGDDQKANHIFNTSFWSSAGLGAALLLPAIIGIIHIDWLIRVPPGYELQARWLFTCTVAAFLLNELKSPFEVASLCRNRFDLRNLIAMSEVLTRVGLVVALFYAVSPRIKYVGFGIVCGTLISGAGAVRVWQLLTPGLRLGWRHFDWGIFKHLAKTGSWVIVNQLGALLYLGIDLIVANRLFGAEASGRYAALLQLSMFIRTFGTSISAVFYPTVLSLYARKDIDGLVSYLNRAIKFVGLALALPIGLVCGFSQSLLRLWVGPEFESLAPLLALLCVHLCINLAINPLLGLQLAANRMKLPGIVTLVMGAGNLGLALFLAGPMHWGLYGIAAAGAIMLTLKNVFFTPLYAARILHQPTFTFLRGLGPIVIAAFLTVGLCKCLALQVDISSWMGLVAAGLGVSIVFGLGIFTFMLGEEERVLLKNLLPKGILGPR